MDEGPIQAGEVTARNELCCSLTNMILLFAEFGTWVENHLVAVLGSVVGVFVVSVSALIGVLWSIGRDMATVKQVQKAQGEEFHAINARLEAHVTDKDAHIGADRFADLKDSVDKMETRVISRMDRLEGKLDRVLEG